MKREWLPFHESLFLTWNPDNLVFLQAFVAALLKKTKPGDIDCGSLLMKSLRQEVQTMLALMEMAFSLERGRYVQTPRKIYFVSRFES